MDDAQREEHGRVPPHAGPGAGGQELPGKGAGGVPPRPDPGSHLADARVAYARIYRSLGFPDKYLSELQVLAKLGVKDTFVQDEIEGLTSGLADSVSRAVGLRPVQPGPQPLRRFPSTRLPRREPADASAGQRRHGALLRLAARAATTRSPCRTPRRPSRASTRRSAPRGAAGTDYFIVLGVDEAERSFSATVDLYLSRTGALHRELRGVPHGQRPGARLVHEARRAGRGPASAAGHPAGAEVRPGPHRPGHLPGPEEGRHAGHRAQGRGAAAGRTARGSPTTRRTSSGISR